MSERFCLHIGTHKTATTSVQRFFARNRDRLRDAGLYYPQQDIVGAPGHYAHHRIAHAIAGQDPQMTADVAREFLGQARATARPGETIFISAEPFFRHSLSAPDDPPGDPEPGLMRYARAVRDACGRQPVTVMVMLRRQDLFLESMYGEHVLSSGYRGQIADFLSDRAWMLDYDRRLSVWSEVFGADAVHVRLFEAESLMAPIERTFVEWLGGTWQDDFETEAEANAGLSRTFVEYKRRMNFTNQPVHVTQALRGWLTRLAATPFVRDLPDRGKYYLTPRQRYDLMDRFAPGNARIARRFFGRDTLFARPVEADARAYDGAAEVTSEEIERITRHLLRMIAQPK